MNRDDDAILSEAVHWHLASEDDAMDWHAFTLWLEADPRHRAAFDEIALTAASVDAHRGVLEQDNAVPAQPAASAPRSLFHGRLRWAGFAIAASLVAVLAVPQMMSPAPLVYETTGKARRVALEDGSSILLAPRSRLSIEGRGRDRMALSGGALFDIRHDPSRQLAITAGGVTIRDIGTRFDVQAQDSDVRVAVVEGQVEVRAEAMATPLQLVAGKGMVFDAGAGTATVSRVPSASVGAWQGGRLTYENARLALVVADLRRYGGVTVDVPAPLRNRRFSGTLIVDDGDAALRDLVQLMGLRLDGAPGGWRLQPR